MTNIARKGPLGLKVRTAEDRKPAGLSRIKGVRRVSAKKASTATPLRKAAQGQTCTLRLDGCLPGTETVVLAHLRLYSAAGMGQKPPDWCAVFACQNCHDMLDRRVPSDPIGDDDILRALMETLRRQFAAGLLCEVTA